MPRSSPDSLLTQATLLLVSALTIVSSMALSPVLPALRTAFADTPNVEVLVRLVLTITALFIVIGAPIAGILIDRLGRKRLLIGATVLYAIAGTAGFWLTSLPAILISRAFLGLATAGTIISATTLMGDYYTGAIRARLAGLQTSAMNIGGVIALLISGGLTGLGWQYPFLIHAVALLCLGFVIVAITEPASTPPAISATPTEIDHNGAIRQLFGYCAMMTTGATLLFFVPVQLPFYIAPLVNGNSALVGIAVAATSFCTAVVSFNYSRLSTILSRPYLITFAFAGLAAGLLTIGAFPIYALTVIGSLLCGTMMGILLPTLSFAATQEMPIALRGRAVSAVTASVFIGQFVSPFISQPLSGWVGLGSTFLMAGGVALLVSVGFFFAARQGVARGAYQNI